MNILILATHLNPGGVSRYAINLAQGLTRRGNTVWIASSGGAWVSLLARYGVQHKNIPIRTKAIVSFQVFFSFLALTSFLKKHNIQIIHANTRVTQCLAYLLWKFSHIPYVSAFHGFYRPSSVRTFIKLEGLAAIAVSVAVKKHCIDDLKIPQEKIYVVHNGIRLEDFSVKKKQKSDFGFKESDYCLGILGRISEEKGHFLAAQALEKLMQKNRNLYLLIAGKGKMEDALKMFLQERVLNGRVKFLDCEAGDFLDILDILLVPSRKEGFGYSIIEAFAKRVPVIGFNVGGISEIIRHGENGILFSAYTADALATAIENLMKDDSMRRKIVAGAAQDVRAFSLDAMADGTEAVYHKVLQ